MTIFLVWLIAVALLLGFSYLHNRRRSAAIQSLASRYWYHYLGRGVPRSLTLPGTQFERATSIWNVIDGDQHGKRFIAFDCRIGVGKGSWRRTVMAVKAETDLLSAAVFSFELTVDHSDDWTILYEPKRMFWPGGLMPVDELEARLSAIAN